MNQEVEIQAIIKNPKEAEKKLKKVGKYLKARKQVDKYFVPSNKDYFKIDPPVEYIRVRYEKDKSHINYSFVRFDRNLKLVAANEYETLVGEPKMAESMFQKIGLIPKVTVVKIRKYFDCDDFEVVLDQVKGLGNFIEVEAKKDLGGVKKTRQACQKFLDDLNVKYEVLKLMGYPRLLHLKQKGINWKKQ